jgi:ubiquinone biosynthesis UbiH/UbiF/VisC/COQ6 family hydroxylase
MNNQIVVCGAGIVGMSCALALARSGQRVTLVAPAAPIAPTDPQRHHPRVYALSPASRDFLDGIGVWDSLPAERMAQVRAMEILGDGNGRVELAAWQAAQPDLAWIVETNEIERVLRQALKLLGVSWLDDRADRLDAGLLHTEKGAALRAGLIVGADGAQSPLRAAAGLRSTEEAYDAVGLVTHLDAQLAHHGTALQWFGEDGVLALLPLPDTQRGPQVSMVWSMRTADARALLALDGQAQRLALQARLMAASRGRLGRLDVSGPLQGFPLVLAHAPLIAPGVALVGDAAHRVHPLAGQGLNLGLADVRALAAAISEREPFRQVGDERVLRRYRRARAEPLLAMRLATDGLYRLFGARAAPLAWLRNAGMLGVDALPEVKRRLIAQASGF